jgi:hypothetical protein
MGLLIGWILENPVCFVVCFGRNIEYLSSKTIKGFSLTLQGIHNVHGCHSLSASMLCVRDTVTDHVLQEHFEDTTSFFVDEAGDTLDTPTTS